MQVEFMKDHWVFAIGFLAQGLFSLRVIVQWWATEKRRQVVAPTLFWKLSLAGSSLLLIYGALRLDIVIILGQVIAFFIYVRNLQLKHEWDTFSLSEKFSLLAIPAFSIVWTSAFLHKNEFGEILHQEWSLAVWTGFIGQWLLNLRFAYQLYYSQKRKISALPAGFWWISLAGSILVLVYAIYRRDPVLFVAQVVAIVPYTRNILFIKLKAH